MFERVPDCERVIIRATATMNDLRGNQSRGEILTIRFNRDNAAAINWEKVLPENIPHIADYFHAHHSIDVGF